MVKAQDTSESAVVDIITDEPGAFEEFGPDLAGLPEEYRDESFLIALASANSLTDLDENFLGALRQIYGTSLISKEDLIGQPFVIEQYRRTVGKFRHRISKAALKFYTLNVLTKQGRGKLVLSGTGMDPIFETIEAADWHPPFLVPKGLRVSPDWTNEDGEPMNGTWYLG